MDRGNCCRRQRAAAHPLQRGLAARLAGLQVGGGVVDVAVGAQEGVALRGPLAVVDAVDDAAQLPGLVAQHAVQAPAALLRLALPRVPAATPDNGSISAVY